MALFGVLAAALIAGAFALVVARNDGDSTTPSPDAPTPTGPGPTGATEPEDGPPGGTIDLGCPIAPEPGRRPSIRIRVVAWCAEEAVRGQAQVKVKVRISNSTDRRVDIRPERFRLLVTQIRARAWTPPRIGTRSRERPFRTRHRGTAVWAVPANPDGAFDRVPGGGGVGTFATHWKTTELAPRATFRPPLSDRGNGVLVFYVPPTGKRATALEGVLGLAYMDGRKVDVLCPPNAWGKRLGAAEF